ncbi:MAG: PilZ domain-containing protein [Nitrospirae bacterium]|nr:PilZ domain-containing protein [Nitrospirota bacterium]
MTSNEKRKAVRVSKRLEVKFHSTSENTAITNDLSAKGLFITTSKGMDPGNAIDIKLHLPNSEALFIKGRVIRNIKAATGLNNGAQSGMGIELINPPEDFINYIQSLHNSKHH